MKNPKRRQDKAEIEVLLIMMPEKPAISNAAASTLPIPPSPRPVVHCLFFPVGRIESRTETILPTCDGRKLKMIKVRTETEKIRCLPVL